MKEQRHQVRLAALAARRNIPLDVSLELTHHCNFRCRHCYIPDFSAPDGLSTERILELLEELVEAGTLYLTLTGGELFLRPDWLQIARRARALGFALRLLSNGSLIDEQIAIDIAALPATVEISLYSMDEVTFESITCRPGSYAKTLHGIEWLRLRDVDVLLKAPLMVSNLEHVDALAAYAESIGAAFQAAPTIVARKDGNLATLGMRAPLESLSPHLVDSQEDFERTGKDGADKGGGQSLCAAANRYCNITASGDVLACNILPGSGGNVRERSFLDIWKNSPWLNEVRSIRREDLHTCKDCSSLPYCGRCHAQALVEDGDLLGPSSYAGERVRALGLSSGGDLEGGLCEARAVAGTSRSTPLQSGKPAGAE